MRLYRIDHRSKPGSRWAGTQDDARRIAKEVGGPWDTVEVPTDKTGLLAFLNFEGGVATEVSNINDQLALAAPTPQPARAGQCQSCQARDPAALERGAQALAAGANASAIADRIMDADGFALGILASAVAERFKVLASRA